MATNQSDIPNQPTHASRDGLTDAPLWLCRLVTLGMGLAVRWSVAFIETLATLDARGSEPRFRGIREANTVILRFGLLVAGIAWLSSLLPRLSRRQRDWLLVVCAVSSILTGVAWVGWARLR